MSLASEGLQRLRNATHQSHTSLEQLTDSDRLLSQEPSLGHYQHLLRAQYLLHCEVARHASALTSGTQLLDWPECGRIELLEADLAKLGASTDLAHSPHSPPESKGFALGLVYVCEGSCLGNQRLLRSMSVHDCFHQWDANRFLSSCANGFAARWREVLMAIEKQSTNRGHFDESRYNEIERGALAGFAGFRSFWALLGQDAALKSPARSNS